MEKHLDPLDLARLAEGRLPEPTRESSMRHLTGCRHCMALYAEFSRTHLDPDTQRRPTDDEWVQLGLGATAGRPAGVAEFQWQRRRRRTLVPVLAALGLVAVGLVGVRSRHSNRVPAETRSILAQLLREDSGDLFYSADLLPPEPRGTRGNQGPPIDSHLDGLRRQFNLHPDDSETAFWLISAYLATNQQGVADLLLTDVLRAFPDDPRFENLAGILAFKRSDLPAAESHLRTAALRDRTGVAKLNLSLVLKQRGSAQEAERLAEEVRKEHSRLFRAAGQSP